MCVLSCVQFFVTLGTVARQSPLSMGFSRQEYWSALLSLSQPRDLPNPGMEPESPAAGRFSLIYMEKKKTIGQVK